MRSSILQSEVAEQLYKCTDKHARIAAQTVFCRSASITQPTAAPGAAARSFAPRFPHRALHTLRQAGLQMRSWPRSRPQVLPLRQSLPTAPANRLLASGLLSPRRRCSYQLSPLAPDFGRDLRHQSRAVSPSRGTLRNLHESGFRNVTLRCRIRQPAARQHVVYLARQPKSCEGGRT